VTVLEYERFSEVLVADLLPGFPIGYEGPFVVLGGVSVVGHPVGYEGFCVVLVMELLSGFPIGCEGSSEVL